MEINSLPTVDRELALKAAYDEDPIQMQVANIYTLVREFRRVFPKEYELIKARL